MAATTAKGVAAIIGYGPGIGHACATLWAKHGYSVALISRTASKLEEASKTIPGSAPFACDITETPKLVETLAAVKESLGPIDHLIYNAGNGVWKTFDEISVEQLDVAMKTNVYGLLTCCQEVTPDMKSRGGGFICITGATASLRGMPFTSAFAAAKAGQRSLAQSIGRQLWKENVHVTLNIIDGAVGDGGGNKIKPSSIADEYWHQAMQTRDGWTFQNHIQTYTSD
eukprot:CAMPEP_0119273764 /NCGR_PEP_ID=MMETSP1329-20130426/10943_1 /TAXON_ID=114041 /ORGANISM="Genus nov. species nov., Strain RCC1024" /LENGTH=226 /DNA_ID=CAMNT_0007274005 /DNA_START=155 /DNA_END=832 /DNA_ORIENTATION=+